MDLKPIEINEVIRSRDGKTVSLNVEPMQMGRVYQLQLADFISVSGDSLANNLICYTINRLRP